MQPFELPASFFVDLGENHYEPTEATIGPWSPTLQHGGPPAALLTHALRNHPCEYGLRIARLTFEILGPVPVEPCSIAVRVVRAGKRIELLRGELHSAGKLLMLAHAWRLEHKPGCSPPVPDPFALPSLPPPQPQGFFPGVDYFPYGHALEWRFSEGSYEVTGPATVWTRPRIPLIRDQEPDGLESTILMLDSANGISAELDFHQWNFVPVDLTLNLHRTPTGLWFGMAARTVLADDGIGTVSTTVFDSTGPVGRSLHTLFVRPR
jgi:hypothetical protein